MGGIAVIATTRLNRVRALLALVAVCATVLAPASGGAVLLDGSQCLRPPSIDRDDIGAANDLLENRYRLPPHPTVQLPADLDWSEDPLGDRNWRFQLHAMRYTWHLLSAWQQTADIRYLDRFKELLQDWSEDNPIDDPPSDFSWNDHSTAWRAMMYACAVEVLLDSWLRKETGIPQDPWLAEAFEHHGRVLADDSFYTGATNHALNQNQGLLAIGCVAGERGWVDMARARLERLLRESVDRDGVTNEQAIDYQIYNHNRYNEARLRLERCGQPVAPEFERIGLMPRFLAHATLPNAQYEMIGDTGDHRASPIPGTEAEFAATKGAAGPKPASPWAFYPAGYAFGRTGWGEARPYEDEVFTSMRFGPARAYHGHYDHGAVTMYGYGSRLLLDSGKYKYEPDSWRNWFLSRAAHNVVTVDGLNPARSATAWLTARRNTSAYDFYSLRHRPYAGVTVERRVLFSRTGKFLIVDDAVSSARTQTFRQLWHLPPDADPWVYGTTVASQRTRGNVTIRQLAGRPAVSIAEGRSSPAQGWVSFHYGQRIAAPTAEYVVRGRSARYLTLIVPSAQPRLNVSVGPVRLDADGFSVSVTIGDRTERISVDGASSAVVPVS